MTIKNCAIINKKKMKNIKILTATLLLSTLVTCLVLVFTKTDTALGSALDGQGYYATSTTEQAAGNKQVRIGNTMLGSVIVSSSSAGTLKIWNATSTTDTASTTVANFVASPANGTYTFDVDLSRGLSVQIGSGFNGSYTITYK